MFQRLAYVSSFVINVIYLMFVEFFNQLKEARVPVTIREYLMLLEAMEKGIAGSLVDDFYLARSALVKDENILIGLIKFLDRFSWASRK